VGYYGQGTRLGSLHEAARFKFGGAGGQQLSYNLDEYYPGLEVDCGQYIAGNKVFGIRAMGASSNGRSFQKNHDGTLSPADARDLVLGFGTQTYDAHAASGQCAAPGQGTEVVVDPPQLILVPKGSSNALIVVESTEASSGEAAEKSGGLYFQVHSVGGGLISLHNPETNRWLRITDTGDVDSPAVGPWNDRWVWERFEAYDLGGGITGLYSPSTHWWLDTTNDGDVRALRLSDWNGWERFKVKVVAGECPAGSFLDNTKCTSVGEDCCAPNGEAATCQGGFFPIKTGVGCFGFREGAYVCCSEPEGICRSTADCRSQPDCVGQMVVCHEGTCYKGNQDAGCDGVTNGERYAGQQEGHWCWDGRSDTMCAAALTAEAAEAASASEGSSNSMQIEVAPATHCLCGYDTFRGDTIQIPDWDEGRTCQTEMTNACNLWSRGRNEGAFNYVKDVCCSTTCAKTEEIKFFCSNSGENPCADDSVPGEAPTCPDSSIACCCDPDGNCGDGSDEWCCPDIDKRLEHLSCASTADCQASVGCATAQFVVCHENLCYKGNVDTSCSTVANGGRYEDQDEGYWCWDGRSDTVCPTDFIPCSSREECLSISGCSAEMVECHEGLCYKGNLDSGCSAIEDGSRYEGQKHGEWCWDGRSDTLCKTPGLGAGPGKDFHLEEQRYKSMIANGQSLTLIPHEFSADSAIVRGKLSRGRCGHSDDCDWLDQPLQEGRVEKALELAIDGDKSSCLLWAVDKDAIMYLHVHNVDYDLTPNGRVTLHNQITLSTRSGWENGANSRWKIRDDGKIEPLHHLPPGRRRVLAWVSNEFILVPEDSRRSATFESLTFETFDVAGCWKVVFRQTLPFLFSSDNDWAQAKSLNENDETSPTYSILGRLDEFSSPSGTLTLKLAYPQDFPDTEANIWTQSSDPAQRTSRGVDGYRVIKAPWTGQHWAGIERNRGLDETACFLDGSVDNDLWWYAIGTTRLFNEGIPGPVHGILGHIVSQVELSAWVDSDNPNLVELCSAGASAFATISTPDSYNYQTAAEVSGLMSIVFSVKTPHDARIALGEDETHLGDKYEIVIGGDLNQRSLIRNLTQGDLSEDTVVSTDAPFVSDRLPKYFWLSWSFGKLRVGRETTVGQNQFLITDLDTDRQINFLLVSTGFGAIGEWEMFVGSETFVCATHTTMVWGDYVVPSWNSQDCSTGSRIVTLVDCRNAAQSYIDMCPHKRVFGENVQSESRTDAPYGCYVVRDGMGAGTFRYNENQEGSAAADHGLVCEVSSTSQASCTICKTGVSNPAAIAGHSCDDNSGNWINNDKTQAQCTGANEVWKSFSCQEMHDYWSSVATARDQCFQEYDYYNNLAPQLSSASECCNAENLKCSAGTHGPDGGPCEPCPAGTYQDVPGSAECSDCPRNSDSPPHSVSQSACKCNAGFTGPDGGMCSECPVTTYKDIVGDYSCTNCLANSDTAAPGSTLASDCKCIAGFTGPDGGMCSECPVATYKDIVGDSECTGCPGNSDTAAPGGTLASDCKCNSGWWGPDGGDCTRCNPGSYNNMPGAASCTMCKAGKYTSSSGAIECSTCPVGKFQAIEGSEVCESCGAGKYQSLQGMSSCQRCEKGKYQEAAGVNTACNVCVAGKFQATVGSTKCDVCVAGKFKASSGVNTDCDDCVAGKYKEAGDNLACDNCAAGKFSVSIGATSESFCEACEGGKTSAAGSALASDCTAECAPGWTGLAGSCTQCSAGKFKAGIGSGACVACPTGSHSLQSGQSSCDCNPGFTGSDGGSCTQCAVGKSKAVRGSADCDQCEAGKFSASTGMSACTHCAAGTYLGSLAATVCTDCGAGKYNPATGKTASGDCIDCSSNGNAYSAAASTAKTDCTCNKGYWGPSMGTTDSSLTCTACVAGKYRADSGATLIGDCENCGVGKYSDTTAATVCTDCGVGKYSTTVGATGASTCNACGMGKYASTTGNAAESDCVSCGAGKYLASTGASSEGSCVACSAGKSSTASGASSSTACQGCVAGKYSATGASTCTSCPMNSNAPAGSVTSTACACNTGYAGPSGGPCDPATPATAPKQKIEMVRVYVCVYALSLL